MDQYLLPTDRRQGSCYRQLVGGKCVTRESTALAQTTKADCCCTIGAAWGPRCERCPQPDSAAHKELCLESGYSVDGSGKLKYDYSLDKFGLVVQYIVN